jgi:acetate---CoA ligase (ADP-forming)
VGKLSEQTSARLRELLPPEPSVGNPVDMTAKMSRSGPMITFELGGIYVETLKDVTFRVPPLTDLDAQEMVRQIRGYKLLEGVRGEQPVDFDGLTQVLRRFSQLVQDLPEVEEIEVKSLMVFPYASDFRVVDARVRVARTRDG